MFVRFATGSLVLGVMLYLGGCAMLQQSVSPPELTLSEVRLVQADLRAQRYAVTLQAYNPNSFSIGVEAIEWQLELAGHNFADGSLAVADTLPARESVPLTLEMQTNLLDYARHALSRLASGGDELEYKLSGTARIKSPLRRNVPFEEIGTVRIQR